MKYFHLTVIRETEHEIIASAESYEELMNRRYETLMEHKNPWGEEERICDGLDIIEITEDEYKECLYTK